MSPNDGTSNQDDNESREYHDEPKMDTQIQISIDDNRTKMPEIKIVHRPNKSGNDIDLQNFPVQDGIAAKSKYRENISRLKDRVRLDDEKMKKIHEAAH